MVRKLHLRAATLAQVYHYCDTMGKLSFTNTPKEWNFEFPKLLELQDNYSRNLQATYKELASDEQARREEKRRDKEKTLKQPNDRINTALDKLTEARSDDRISDQEFQSKLVILKAEKEAGRP